MVITGLAVIPDDLRDGAHGAEDLSGRREQARGAPAKALLSEGLGSDLAARGRRRRPRSRCGSSSSATAAPRTGPSFRDLARRMVKPAERAVIEDSDLLVVVPAFVVGELAAAFKIGFLIFVPFLIIDLLVANVLLALGMHICCRRRRSRCRSSCCCSLLVDGWALLGARRRRNRRRSGRRRAEATWALPAAKSTPGGSSGHARLRRHPHPLRCSGDVGSVPHALVPARRVTTVVMGKTAGSVSRRSTRPWRRRADRA